MTNIDIRCLVCPDLWPETPASTQQLTDGARALILQAIRQRVYQRKNALLVIIISVLLVALVYMFFLAMPIFKTQTSYRCLEYS